MIEIPEECTGCMACANRCPAGAVSIGIDAYGYRVPVIDKSHCTACGLCAAVCPVLRDRIPASIPRRAFSAYHVSDEIVRKSSSGGAFYALAEAVLRQGGIVFGCYYDLERKEARLEDTDHLPLDLLLTSKYVESRVGMQYRKVEKELQAGRTVLFCSTPCQVAGLRSFLRKEYPNLLLVDFACGAVSSNQYLTKYLEDAEVKARSRIVRMSFRDKHYGWGQYCMMLAFENGTCYRKTAMYDPYFFCFLRSSMQRLSCHGCRFSDAHRSDLCLSDFWKCDSFEVERNGRRGLSLILVFTEKGERFLREAAGRLHVEELDTAAASYHLKPRTCPEEKLTEIHRDMACAYREGVAVLRKRLLSLGQRLRFAFRQFVMDHPKLAAHFPELVGRGQIMKPDR